MSKSVNIGRVRGNILYTLETVSGRDVTHIYDISVGIVGDLVYNPISYDVYRCIKGGNSITAEWEWKANLNANALRAEEASTKAEKALEDINEAIDPVFVDGLQTTISTEDGGENVYTFTDRAGRETTLIVRNGSRGSKGDSYDITDEDYRAIAQIVSNDYLKSAKFPNVTIIGEPTITQGQISNFSENNYLRFPFVVNFQDKPFTIVFDITTGTNVTGQQNVFDSNFGLAFAVRNSRFVMAVSTNGTSWEGEHVGNTVVAPETNYRVIMSWDGSSFTMECSSDGGNTYTTDMQFALANSPYPKQILIGKGIDGHVFGGMINLNYAELHISNKLVWLGMEDVGFATRMAIDMSNIDEAGIEVIREIVQPDIDSAVTTGTKDVIRNYDYATTSKAGIIRPNTSYGSQVTANGTIASTVFGKHDFNNLAEVVTFVSKGTLDNVLSPYIENDHRDLRTLLSAVVGTNTTIGADAMCTITRNTSPTSTGTLYGLLAVEGGETYAIKYSRTNTSVWVGYVNGSHSGQTINIHSIKNLTSNVFMEFTIPEGVHALVIGYNVTGTSSTFITYRNYTYIYRDEYSANDVRARKSIGELKEGLVTQQNTLDDHENRIDELEKGGGSGYDDTEIRQEIATKITKPTDAPTVGKVLKVKSVNEDDTFVCEWADAGGSSTDYKMIDTITVEESVDIISVDFTKPLKAIYICFKPEVSNSASGLITLYDESLKASFGYFTQMLNTSQRVTIFEARTLPTGVDASWYSVNGINTYPSSNANKTAGISRYMPVLDKISNVTITCTNIPVGTVVTILGVEK